MSLWGTLAEIKLFLQTDNFFPAVFYVARESIVYSSPFIWVLVPWDQLFSWQRLMQLSINLPLAFLEKLCSSCFYIQILSQFIPVKQQFLLLPARWCPSCFIPLQFNKGQQSLSAFFFLFFFFLVPNYTIFSHLLFLTYFVLHVACMLREGSTREHICSVFHHVHHVQRRCRRPVRDGAEIPIGNLYIILLMFSLHPTEY